MPAPSGRERYRRPGRREAFRDRKPIILIVCEGGNTEPQYLEQFAEFHRNSRVRIELAGGCGVPLTVVRKARDRKNAATENAKREKDDNLKYDAVWCAFDRDDHPNIGEATLLAVQNGIEIAMSNPSFELWLLLHLRDAPGMLHRAKARAMLRTYVPEYDKNVDFERYRPGYEKAVQRAKDLDRIARSINDPGRNPTTGFYLLTESIIATDATESIIATSAIAIQLVFWGDGSRVPVSRQSLAIVGLDNDDGLHIRIFDAAGNYTDTDETNLPAALAGSISILKHKVAGLMPPHVLTPAETYQLATEVKSILGEASEGAGPAPVDQAT